VAKSGTGTKNKPAASQKRPATSAGKPPASRPQAAAPQPRPVMPRWLKYTLAGLIIFTLTLRTGPMIPLLVCAFALGLGVWQLWQRRARMWWTGAMFLAVGLYVLGMFLTRWHASLWLFFFAAWIFVIVSVVAEAGRSMEQRKAQGVR
jgi:hypothetical protein